MKRYINPLTESKNGDWVRYEDAAERIAELKAWNEGLRKVASAYRDRMREQTDRAVKAEAEIEQMKDVMKINSGSYQILKEENERLRSALSIAGENIRDYDRKLDQWEEDAERLRELLDGLDGIAICKEGVYGTPWVAVGANEALELIDAARGEG